MPNQAPPTPPGSPPEPSDAGAPGVGGAAPGGPGVIATPRSAPATTPRTVHCAKLGKELPGLTTPPFPTALGERILAAISQQAWSEWLLHSQRVINERGLNLADPQARAAWLQECEAFLFGGGAAPPPGWVPPAGFVRLETKKGRGT